MVNKGGEENRFKSYKIESREMDAVANTRDVILKFTHVAEEKAHLKNHI